MKKVKHHHGIMAIPMGMAVSIHIMQCNAAIDSHTKEMHNLWANITRIAYIPAAAFKFYYGNRVAQR
jgi:hypothetical protein